jgi:hypothetical protein
MDQDQIVQVADHGHKVRDQVDWTKGLADDTDCENPRVKWQARVAIGQIQGADFSSQGAGAALQVFDNGCDWLVSSDGRRQASLEQLIYKHWRLQRASGSAGVFGAAPARAYPRLG